MKLTIKAELNMFIKGMVKKPLQEGIEKIADALATDSCGPRMKKIKKLWHINFGKRAFEVNKEIERFTVGRDRELDLYLARYDVLGSMAHITMLESIGLLEKG